MTTHLLALETSSSVCAVALLSQGEGAPVLRGKAHDATAEHAERLLPMVDELLDQAGITASQLSAVAFGQGPGGFTGMRVACGVAQGIAFALGIPVIPVVSLLAIAVRDQTDNSSFQPSLATDAIELTNSIPDTIRVVVQDARMGEVYVAAYCANTVLPLAPWRVLQAPVLLDATDLAAWLQQMVPLWQATLGSGNIDTAYTLRLLGDALRSYPELIGDVAAYFPAVQAGPPLRADAESIALLAQQDWLRQATVAPDDAAPLYVRDKVAYTTAERQQGQGGNPKAPSVAPSIRPMAVQDLDDVAAIEKSVQDFPWSRRSFEDGLKAGYAGWVSSKTGETTGFCLVMFAPDVAHVLVLAVSPQHQKQGLGAMLLRECEHQARARGLPAMILEVRQSNANAIAFYQHVGFTVLSTRKDYYPSLDGREDAFVMEKRLTARRVDNA